MLSSRDGYCTLVVFDEILPAHHTQQHTLQLQSIAHHHALPLTNSAASVAASAAQTPLSTPLTLPIGLPSSSGANAAGVAISPVSTLPPPLPSLVPAKRSAEPPLTPAASVDENVGASGSVGARRAQDEAATDEERPRKKRRAALTRVGDLGS